MTVAILLSLGGYALATSILHQLGIAPFGSLWAEAIPPAALVAVLGVLHAVLRPRWPVVAQGYLEAWPVEVLPYHTVPSEQEDS